MNPLKRRAGGAHLTLCLATLGFLAPCFLVPDCRAADSDIVGAVALLVDPAVAKQLNLSLTQREKYAALVNRRENEALELANLPPQEQAAKLADFRSRTEQEAIADLTEVQRAAFAKVRLGRAGVESLAERQVASQLSLTDEQQKKITALLTERAGRLTVAATAERPTIRGQYDQQIAGVLSPEQKSTWEKLAGVPLAVPTGNVAAAPTTPATPVTASDAMPPVAADTAKAPVDATAKQPETPAKGTELPVTKPGADQTPAEYRALKDLESKASPKEGPSRSYGRRKGDFRDRGFGETRPPFGKPGDPKTPNGAKLDPNQKAKPTGIETPVKSHDGLIQFSFRNQPWSEVLDWFAGQAGLSLYMETPPTGVFNYSSPERYTPEKAIDLLNSALWMKGLVLIRNDRMLMLVKTDDIPPILVPVVSENDLEKRGDYELVRVIFQLENATPEEVQQEIRPLVSKQGGSIEILSKARQIQVTETAGHLRAIRKVIESIENPKAGQQIHTIELKHATADQVLGPARIMLGLPPDGFAATDGSLRIMVEPVSGNLLVTGRTEKINQLRAIVKALDKEPNLTDPTDGVIETPQLEVYAVSTADPAMVLAVLSTMMAGQPDIRLDKDAKTGSLVAWARPSQHRAIKAIIDQLQKDAKQVEVIRLKKVDPALAMLAIQKLFGGADATGAQAPIVDAEPVSRQLMVRATAGQIDQIRSLLRKMGEQESDESLADKSKIRVLPLTGRQARTVLEQAEILWPVQGSNKIRVVRPSAPEGTPANGVPTRGTAPERASTSAPTSESARLSQDIIEELRSRLPRRSGELPAKSNEEERVLPRDQVAPDALDRRTQRPARARIQLVAAPGVSSLTQTDAKEPAAPQGESKPDAPSPPNSAPATKPRAAKSAAKSKPGDGKEPAPIIVTVTPGGIVISSEDTQALDDFEDLVNTLSSTASSGGREFTVFYLKHAKAVNAAELLEEVFGGGSSSSGSGGGSLLGDLAGAALGGSGGGLVSSLLGGSGGSGGFSTGLVDIVPDTRLNALIVQANPTDLDSVEQLLKVVDQPSSPEQVEVPAKPRFIQVYNNQADDIATIVRQVYSEHITGAGAANANQMRQPSPEDFIRMLRGAGGGGRGRGGRGNRNEREEAEKMTVSVDGNSNSLIVAAPENLFNQVKTLVAELDRVPSESRQSTQVVTLRRASPIVVQQALTGLLGDKVKSNTLDTNTTGTSRTSTSSTSQTSSQTQRSGQGFGPFGQQGGDAEDRMRRFQEFREMMRQGGGRDGGGRDGGGRNGGGRDGGGRGGRGGRGGDRD